jgi:tRNA pseudouridine32 synthase / 23S rRNA pseudouridine746 synthase
MGVDWVSVRAQGTVYEDDDCLVLDKPADLALIGARDGDDLMTSARNAGEWLTPAHRIDRVTSGLVLLAKSREAHSFLTGQFRDRTVTKRYLAIVHGIGLPDRGTIDLPLRRGRKGQVRVAAPRDQIEVDEWALRWWADADRDDAKPATTTFERVAESASATLLRATPVTGRRHQIRVHFAWIGHPVVGDPLFESEPFGRTRLHSADLEFESPSGIPVACRRDPAPEFFEWFEASSP